VLTPSEDDVVTDGDALDEFVVRVLAFALGADEEEVHHHHHQHHEDERIAEEPAGLWAAPAPAWAKWMKVAKVRCGDGSWEEGQSASAEVGRVW
jgi:hypothetical protein